MCGCSRRQVCIEKVALKPLVVGHVAHRDGEDEVGLAGDGVCASTSLTPHTRRWMARAPFERAPGGGQWMGTVQMPPVQGTLSQQSLPTVQACP